MHPYLRVEYRLEAKRCRRLRAARDSFRTLIDLTSILWAVHMHVL